MRKPRANVLSSLSLNIDAELVNDDYEKSREISTGYEWGDTTYRHDGFTIGKDYLRLEGRTISRDDLSTPLQVNELIGEGAFSQVFKAKWQDSPFVAVKRFCLLESSPQRRDMVLKELRALCRVDCECLVKLEGAFLAEGAVTMVLEYMNRGSLEDLLRQNHTKNHQLDEPTVAAIAYQMLMGLSYLHQLRVIHRDIKPGNVLLHDDGSVKLCDFGLASLNDQSLSTTVVGTTRYMAPERLRSKPYGRASDLWSYGLVILQCLTGDVSIWKDCNSMVHLVITVEETKMDDLLNGRNLSAETKEFLSYCLQEQPGKFRDEFENNDSSIAI